MLVRWTRKALVLSLAALGVQYLRMITRIVFAELRPEHPRVVPAHIPETPLPARTQHPVARRLVITTLEPHGAL